MTEHLSTEIVERFHQQALAPGECSHIYIHTLTCEACRQRIVDSGIEAVGLQATLGHLVESNEEPYHPDYETIERYIEGRLERIDQDTIAMHLEVCPECLGEVADLRDSVATMTIASVLRHGQEANLRERILGLTKVLGFSSPLRLSTFVAIVIVAMVAGVVLWSVKSGGPTKAPAGGGELTTGPRSPSQSTLSPQVGVSPLPTSELTPDRTVKINPTKRASQPGEEILALNDGSNRITLDESGNVLGLASLPRETLEAVREVLTTQTIKRPDILDEWSGAEVSLRAPTGNEEPAKLVYPNNIVITEDQPSFEWALAKGARAYRVEIGDPGFRQVAKSENLPAASHSWRPPAPLERGVIYTWVVRALYEGSGSAAVSQARFKVLEAEKTNELVRLKTASQSHLALGVFYAREGMIREAQLEFETLAQANKGSKLARRLLKQVQLWQKR